MRTPGSEPMTSLERRATFGLAGIFMLRMLGLFMILPVFAIFAEHLPGATGLQIGLALGVYGLTQAIFQIPFGIASDRFGRKPVILLGLIIFIIGSIVAANATTIETVIVGRALQGGGAIAAAVLAMLADLTREHQRTKAMALVGISIGASFILSFVIGPVLNSAIGVPGIFWLTAVLAGGGMLVLFLVVPSVSSRRRQKSEQSLTNQLKQVLREPELLRLDIGIFALHCALMAMFVAIPLALVHEVRFPAAKHGELYLSVMLLSILIMVPFMLYSERKGALKPVFLGAIAVIAASQAVFYAEHGHFWGIVAGLIAFFAGFNLLEATLPSLISKNAPVDRKGMAIGIYNSFEFFGAFVGGTAGGWLYQHHGQEGVYLFSGTVLLVWALVAAGMRAPRRTVTHTLHFGALAPDVLDAVAAQLEAIEGVSEVIMVADKGVVYVRSDGRELDQDQLESIASAAM